MPSFIMHYMPPYVDPSHSPVASHSTLFLWLASSQRWPRKKVQASWTRSSAILINEDIKGFFKDSSLWKLNLKNRDVLVG